MAQEDIVKEFKAFRVQGKRGDPAISSQPIMGYSQYHILGRTLELDQVQTKVPRWQETG